MVKNNCIKKNNKRLMKTKYGNILLIVVVLAVLYLVINSFFGTSVDQEYLKTIDSLNNNILKIEQRQDSLSQDIKNFETQVNNIDSKIQTIKNQKTIIKEYFHEKIISVDGFSRNDIDSFFANRYGYNP